MIYIFKSSGEFLQKTQEENLGEFESALNWPEAEPGHCVRLKAPPGDSDV